MLVQSIINTSIHSGIPYASITKTPTGTMHRSMAGTEPTHAVELNSEYIVTLCRYMQVKHYHSINNVWQYGT